ncbi:MAG: hypothetical protein HFG28_14410 [Eubacterium sp.]|nr:hypothetical protein [Eubacterium sp.]
MTEKEYKQKENPCWGCGCWDPDMGCIMPAIDKIYACSLEAEGRDEDDG